MQDIQLRELGLSQTVEILIETNTTTKFKFSDNLINLDNALVHAIALGSGVIGKSVTNKTVLDFIYMNSTYLTLMGYKNEQFNYRLPLRFFFTNDNPVLFIKPKLISFRNSYIEFPDAATLVIPPGGYAVVFTIFYEKFDPLRHQLDKGGELIEPEI